MMRYMPEGDRGFGMHSIMTNFEWGDPTTMMAETNRETLAILQIESRSGLEAVERIAATPGLRVCCSLVPTTCRSPWGSLSSFTEPNSGRQSIAW